MITYGKGGWTYNDLYNMPVFLRMYYMKKLADAVQKESESVNKTITSNTMRPNIKPG